MNESEDTSAIDPELPEWNAGLERIFISPGHDYWGRQGDGRMTNGIRDCAEVRCVAGKGLEGDRYFGYRENFKGQVTFFDQAVVDAVRAAFRLPKLPASVFRRNLVVSGVALRDWLGKRFRFQGIVFEGSQECRPCDWMNRVIDPGAEDFLKIDFRGGLRAKVLSSGLLRVEQSHSGKLKISE